MRTRSKMMATLVAVSGLVALATEPALSADVLSRDDYYSQCNRDGFVIRGRKASGRQTIYLGKRCDAFAPDLGWGKWCWARNGFLADFQNSSVDFQGDRPKCDARPALGDECQC